MYLSTIQLGPRRADVTAQELRRRLEEIVSEVEVAYWSLGLAYKEVEARQGSLELAEDQVNGTLLDTLHIMASPLGRH